MNVKNILNKNEFNFKKKLGQNFLLDDNILNKIVDQVTYDNKNILAIEVGVGAAALTRKVAKKANNVLGYEIDETLKEPLKEILKEYDNIDLIFDDFLNRSVSDDIEKYNYDEIVVIANLPYYITTPIIEKFIYENINIEKMVLMVQNEVADRFSAKPNTKNYNSLTIFLNYYYDVKKEFIVSKNSFYPKPNVDSAIVSMTKKKEKYKVLNEEHFFKLVRDSFKQKRKTLKNNLKGYNWDIIKRLLQNIGKSETCRAEELSIENFIYISNEMN